MPRLFTGIEIPTSVSNDLALKRAGFTNARWIEPSDYHVTLCFLGDVSPSQAEEVRIALSKIEKPAFSLQLSGMDSFGSKKPKSVHATLKHSDPLIALQSAQATLFQRMGMAIDMRKFTPHITVARLRNESASAVASYLARSAWVDTRAFDVERFVLYSAKESTGGGPYIIEEAYPLSL